MDIKYCGSKCHIGKEKSNEFLTENNSAFDAAMDFIRFTEECFKTCLYKDCHEENLRGIHVEDK